MGKKSLITVFLVLVLSVWALPGLVEAWGDRPCAEMNFTLIVHNQTAHTIEVGSYVYDPCNSPGTAVQEIKTIPKGQTVEIKWAGSYYKFNKETYVRFETRKLIDAGRLQITNHIKEKYSGSDLLGRHDVYLNQNLVIMAF